MSSRRSLSRKKTLSARQARAGERRRKARILALVGSLAILAAFIVFLRSSRFALRRAEPVDAAERQQIALRLRQALERAVGEDVWVKSPPFAAFPPCKAETATEAFVARASYKAALSALERQAAREGLEIKPTRSSGRDPSGLRDFRLLRGRSLAGRWIVREVPRLRHAALILDDLGQDLDAVRQLIALPYPITFAVLPHLAHSKAVAEQAHRAGREVMLHLPMEPDSPARPGPGEIRVGMGRMELEQLIEEDLRSVPFVAGVNNHRGSRATRDRRLMEELMEVLARRGLFFIDSRTTPLTVALAAARRRGIPTFYRSVFLDETETVPYVLGQLREFIRVVEGQDAAIAIGHPYPSTLAALTQFLPELERRGIRLLPASELLRRPEIAHLTSPAAEPQSPEAAMVRGTARSKNRREKGGLAIRLKPAR